MGLGDEIVFLIYSFYSIKGFYTYYNMKCPCLKKSESFLLVVVLPFWQWYDKLQISNLLFSKVCYAVSRIVTILPYVLLLKRWVLCTLSKALLKSSTASVQQLSLWELGSLFTPCIHIFVWLVFLLTSDWILYIKPVMLSSTEQIHLYLPQ